MVALAACSGDDVEEAPPPVLDDEQFLQLLDDADYTYTDRAETVELGRQICSVLDSSGMTTTELLSSIHPGAYGGEMQAIVFVSASTVAFCPQHVKKAS